MAVLKNKDNTECIITCNCGCDEGVRLKIDKEDELDLYFLMSYTNGKFYSEQGETVFQVLKKKLKKIWAIIKNKDFYYSEICMTKKEFEEFKDYINSIK